MTDTEHSTKSTSNEEEDGQLLALSCARTNRHANKAASVLEWYDRHRAYSIKYTSNEEEDVQLLALSCARTHNTSYRLLTSWHKRIFGQKLRTD